MSGSREDLNGDGAASHHAAPDRAGEHPAARTLGLVLCGGASRRMGHDKAMARLGEETLLERAVAQVAPVVDSVALACGAARRYAALGLPLVLDPPELASERGPGPAAGILAALEALAPEWLVVLACDMPRVEPELLARLLEQARTGGLDACLFERARGVEPLCAVYRRTVAAPMRRALEAGRHAVVAFTDFPGADGRALRLGRLREDALEPGLRDRDPALNLNSPEELERERRARLEATA